VDDSALTEDIPFGPFEGTLITVYAAAGSKSRVHAGTTCSLLRSTKVRELNLPLTAVTVRQMCQTCAQWGRWARPDTALGIFLDSLTGLGLLYQLAAYLPSELDEELADADADPARAAELLSRGDWPDDHDDEDLDAAYEQARELREYALRSWRRAADSVHAAFDVVARYPWLADWARSRLDEKIACVERLRSLVASLIPAGNLVDAAAAALLPEPDLPIGLPGVTVPEDRPRTRSFPHDAWLAWQRNAEKTWRSIEDDGLVGHYLLADKFGRKRKGRDEAEQALRNLFHSWAELVEHTVDAAQGQPDMFLVATIPRAEHLPGRESDTLVGFDELLTQWHCGVLAVYTVAADWQHRVALLRVPHLIGKRLLLERDDLRCADLAHDADPTDDTSELLATWVHHNLSAPETALLPGVLDDGTVETRRAITIADVNALKKSGTAVNQRYLVYSVSNGVETLHLDQLAQRCSRGWHGVILAGEAGLPASLVDPWIEDMLRDADAEGTPQRIGSRVDMRAGERLLLQGLPFRGEADVRRDLRRLALARTAQDLRSLNGNERSRSSDGLGAGVWHALLAFTQLHLNPFLLENREAPRWRGGLGLPLSVLADVQIYTTNADPAYGKGHTPECRHVHRVFRGVDFGDDLLTVADLLRRRDFDWCSTCGGYAVRRLSDSQFEYYEAAHRLREIHERVESWTRDGGDRPRRADVVDLVDTVTALGDHEFEHVSGWSLSDGRAWNDAVRSIRGKAESVLTSASAGATD
jgi:hypothetical protein